LNNLSLMSVCWRSQNLVQADSTCPANFPFSFIKSQKRLLLNFT
jgi:hypothetical protein